MYSHPEPPEGEGSDPPELQFWVLAVILILAALVTLALGTLVIGVEEVWAVEGVIDNP